MEAYGEAEPQLDAVLTARQEGLDSAPLGWLAVQGRDQIDVQTTGMRDNQTGRPGQGAEDLVVVAVIVAAGAELAEDVGKHVARGNAQGVDQSLATHVRIDVAFLDERGEA